VQDKRHVLCPILLTFTATDITDSDYCH